MDQIDTNQQTKSQLSRKHIKLLLLILCSAGLLLTSCSGDNGTSTGPPPIDDEPNRKVSFSKDIQSTFEFSCATSPCHDSGTQNSGVNLSSYEAALNSVGLLYEKKVINPGNPDASPLVDKIEEDPDFGVRMPHSRAPLSQAKIDSIRAWIEDGAPNN